MKNTRRDYKRQARGLLKGHRTAGAMLTLLLILFSAFVTAAEELIGALTGLSYFTDPAYTPDNFFDNRLLFSPQVMLLFGGSCLLSFLISAPLRLGEKLWYLHISAGDPARLTAAFCCYYGPYRYFRAVVFELRLAVRKAVTVFLCFLPVIAFVIAIPLFGLLGLPELLLYPLIFVLILLLLLTAGALSVYWLGRFFLAEYIFALYSCRMRDAFRLSALIMKARKNELFTLKLSFLPLFAADLLLLPRLFTVPYREAVYARCAGCFMEAYERKKEPAPITANPRFADFATREFPCASSI